jgi:putative oxidoreductase
MRIVFGLMFMTHGLQKFGMLGGQAVPLASVYGAAAIIEVSAGIMIAIGLQTRVAAFVAAGEMAVAYFTAHQPQGMLPVQNMGMPAVLFCFAFLYLAARGAGIWGLDSGRSGQHVSERRDRAA